MSMIPGFTPFLEHAFSVGVHEARKTGADAILPPHVFVGLMHKDSGLTSAVLDALGFRYNAVIRTTHKLFGIYTPCASDEAIDLSPTTAKAMEFAKQIANGGCVDAHHVLIALLFQCTCEETELTKLFLELNLDPDDIYKAAQQLVNDNIEVVTHSPSKNSPVFKRTQRIPQNAPALPQTLARFGKDLTALAERDLLDPITGRDLEIQRAIRTLLRRRKSNPCFIGKAGVGKSAVVEGIAQKIADGDVPEQLQGCRIIELSVGSLLSGTKYRGDFEDRLEHVIKEAASNPQLILFFDEMHTLLEGNGAESSGMSAANVLKPALARGAIRVIGATTVEEYRKYVQKDAALERRFQCITVDEPSIEQSVDILKNLRVRYETHHGITIEDDALFAAVELSNRYINDRQLPDKAVDILDEAASKIQLQNKNVMRKEDIAQIISEMTDIPVGNINEDEGSRLINLEKQLHRRVIGQDDAVNAVARAIRRNRAGLNDENRPVGSFLFLGPTGVGKTELSLALSRTLYLHKDALIRLDMSEFMESASVSKVVGAAPGYVGFDSTTSLTEKITQKPYSVLLFDEIEKAHPDVWNILLQILDAGTLTDSSGREVSFKNTIVIVTSNIGAEHMVSPTKSLGFATASNDSLPCAKIIAEMKKVMRPELVNRFDEIIVFDKLTMKNIEQITLKMTRKVSAKAEKIGVVLTFTEEAIQALSEKGFDPAYGARPLRRVIQREVEDALAELLIKKEVVTGDIVECDFDGEFRFPVKKAALTT